jgi:tRNA(Ile2) C34 agmatinyltransferase TiaS
MAQGKTWLTRKENAQPTDAPACSVCGQPMEYAGFNYYQCMNAECSAMGKKVKSR